MNEFQPRESVSAFRLRDSGVDPTHRGGKRIEECIYGFHPGCGAVAMCDGSAKTLNEAIGVTPFCNMITYNGRAASTNFDDTQPAGSTDTAIFAPAEPIRLKDNRFLES